MFSDMVWDDVLKKTKYLTHFSEKTLNLFHCKEDIKPLMFSEISQFPPTCL